MPDTGISHCEITKLQVGELSAHQKAIAKFCKIDSVPLHTWKHPVDEKMILQFLHSRMSHFSLDVYIPFEQPFIIKAHIEDYFDFVRSIWRTEGTLDLIVYTVSPAAVIQLQDLEYELAYFEVPLEPLLTS